MIVVRGKLERGALIDEDETLRGRRVACLDNNVKDRKFLSRQSVDGPSIFYNEIRLWVKIKVGAIGWRYADGEKRGT